MDGSSGNKVTKVDLALVAGVVPSVRLDKTTMTLMGVAHAPCSDCTAMPGALDVRSELTAHIAVAKAKHARQRARIATNSPAMPKQRSAPTSAPTRQWFPVQARALDGAETRGMLRTLLSKASARILVTQFLLDVRPDADEAKDVLMLLQLLVAARGRGLDVRVLLPVVEPTEGTPYDVNWPAAQYLASRGVAVRTYRGTAERPRMHAKPVVIDDVLVIGNGNWTSRSFRVNGEVGLSLAGADLANAAALQFERVWSQATVVAAETLIAIPPASPIARGLPDEAATFSESGRASLLAGQAYVREVSSAIFGATQHVWVSVFGLRATTAARLNPLVRAMSDAARRGLDVRVLVDSDPQSREIAMTDVAAFREAGMVVRVWPLRSRLHARSVLVDDTAFVGSVGWTPASIFLTHEMAVALQGSSAIATLTQRYEAWWSMAATPPNDWSIDSLGWPSAVVRMLLDHGYTTLGELAASTETGAVGVLAGAARLVLLHRVPPATALAMLTARARRSAGAPTPGRPA